MENGKVIQALQQEAGETLGNSHAEKKIVENLPQLLFPIKELFPMPGAVSERFHLIFLFHKIVTNSLHACMFDHSPTNS